MTLRFAIIAFFLLFALGLGVSWAIGSWLTKPDGLSSDALPAGDFFIASTDDVKLAASFHPKGGSRLGLAGITGWLNQAGYATLAIDLRGHGQTTSTSYSFGWNESRDAAAAFHWLRQRQHGAPVAVLGISLGGAAALLGDGPLPADALILQSVYGDIRGAIRNRIATVAGSMAGWLFEPLLSYQSRPRIGVWPDRLSPRTSLGAYRGPVLILGGAEDRYTPPAEIRALYAKAPGPKRLWFIPGTDHAASTAHDSPAYRRELLGFLKTYMPPA